MIKKYKLLKDLSSKLSWVNYDKTLKDNIVKNGAIFDLNYNPDMKDQIYEHAHNWNTSFSFKENLKQGYMLVTARLSEILKHPDFFKAL